MVKPKSLSASSVSSFETCPSMWLATSVGKPPQGRKPAADLGTACHDALEAWVLDDYAFDESAELSTLLKLFDEAYYRLFGTDESRRDEGHDMLKTWYKRSHPLQNEVLNVEVKEHFDIKWPDGDVIPFNYIFDREDRWDDGTIEVVDYKSISFPLSPDMMREKFQVRAYALAAQIRNPEAPGVWVTYDMLRHEPVSVFMKKETNAETWKYLKNVVKRVHEEDPTDPTEKVNELCRWCVRNHVCKTLQRYAESGGVHASVKDHVDAANRRAQLENAKKALQSMIEDMDEVIMAYMKKEDVLEYETDDVIVKATAQKRREVDPERARMIIGDDLFEEYGYHKMSMKDFDKLLKDDRVDRDMALELKGVVKKNFTSPSVKTVAKRDEDE